MKIFTLTYTGPQWKEGIEKLGPMKPRENVTEVQLVRIVRTGATLAVANLDLEDIADLEVGESHTDYAGDTWTRTH